MGFLRGLGTTEILIILGIVVLLFGGGLVRKVARRAGETTKEIKKAKKDFQEAVKEEKKV
ncbi:hypothetical protein A2V80_01420 [Candidatus Woesebacteria bacterium RBG_16_39_8b]|uniref:Sec-independent protein translocase protein TatA n=1 Tax=Candidatus Woesebacteria bacterium RBG_16_39_8b TaxID=1802482 RepID=A0A1F7X8N7_9BACT|nr:MAG: hypothetical protein A2V80_01420 [Candidatus Woesebacteria bacterium RBG_16_39_8b]